MGLFDRRMTGHSMKRPPKKCTECRKPLRSEMTKDGVKWGARSSEEVAALYCQCPRCLHNIIDGSREPGVCDECKDKGDVEQ